MGERQVPDRDPLPGGGGRDRAAHLEDGPPRAPVRTPTSCQRSPPGAPSTLATASLAANRAAREAVVRGDPEGSICSSGVNRRSLSPGLRSRASPNLAIAATSIPTPTIRGGAGLG